MNTLLSLFLCVSLSLFLSFSVSLSPSFSLLLPVSTGATKGALDMLTKVMALELGPHQLAHPHLTPSSVASSVT